MKYYLCLRYCPLDLSGSFAKVSINEAFIQKKTSELQKGKLSGDVLAGWLLRAITMIDLTTLGGEIFQIIFLNNMGT
jgi:hypothetical protein